MAKFNRYNGEVLPFGQDSSSGERWVFGSKGTSVSNNIDDNLNADFLKGWEAGLDQDGFPTSQDFNAQIYTTSLLISYLFQTGIAGWNTKQEYHENSIAIGDNGNIYQSLSDDNKGNNPVTDSVNWISFASKYTLDINGLTEKLTPAHNDILVIEDSADSFNKKKIKISSIISTELPSITGTATATNSNNNIQMTGVGLLEGLTIGDVIELSGFTNSENNELFTVEVITDANNIIVNQRHRGRTRTGSGTAVGLKSLINESNVPNVTVKIISKWNVAPSGLGRAWINMTNLRAATTPYPNHTNRDLEITATFISLNDSAWAFEVSDVSTAIQGDRTSSNFNGNSITVTRGSSYQAVANNGNPFQSLVSWSELA